MSLFILKRLDCEDHACYDETMGVVVRARRQTEARELASKEAGDEGAATWLDPKKTSCRPLRVYGPYEVILRDFNAG